MIYVINIRRKLESIKKEFPNAYILDVTSTSNINYAKWLSPFFPHGNIPIPGDSHGMTATCVEAIWQGLKVFQSQGISLSTFQNRTMKGLKRTVKRLGKPKGHQFGVYSNEILDYYTARMKIYLPAYKYVLDNIDYVHRVIEHLKQQSLISDIVLLDYNTNINIEDTNSPLSHAGLIKLYIEGNYPSEKELKEVDCSINGKVKIRNKRKRRSEVNSSTTEPSLFNFEE